MRTTLIPHALTSLIGREQEIAAVLERLRGARLLTLTGPGGSGKTRLAQAVAERLRDQYPDGLVFVALAAITDPNLVMPAIVRALGLSESARLSALAVLTGVIRERTLLLVLDNCEQVLGAAVEFVELLTACPGLTILVTSREPLRVRGERQHPVPPLAVPDAAQLPPIDALAAIPAVRLLCERGWDVQPAFALTPENAAAVAGICRRLDGLPLALELAAARLKLFTPQALLARLDRRLAVLTGGPRDAPARQRTLRDTIAWSHDLLDGAERALFRRLGAFVGGCTLEAAEAVCADPSPGPSPARGGEPGLTDTATDSPPRVGEGPGEGPDVLDGVTSLVEKNLLRREDGPGCEPRFTLLETIREFALEQLADCGEQGPTEERHVAFMLALAERERGWLVSPDAPAVRARLEADLDNLRAALRWCLEHDSADLGSRIVQALTPFWSMRGSFQELGRWAEQLLELPSAQSGTGTRGWLRVAAAVGISNAGDRRRARPFAEEALAIARVAGDTNLLAAALGTLGNIVQVMGEDAAAKPLLDESLDLHRGLRNSGALVHVLHYRAWLATQQGDSAGARSLMEEAITIARSIGDPDLIGFALYSAGAQAILHGDDRRAVALYEESFRVRRALGENLYTALARTSLAQVMLRQGDHHRAAAVLSESLQILRRFGATFYLLAAVEATADMAYRRGEAARAARLLAAAQTQREGWGEARWFSDEPPFQASVAAVRTALGEESFAAAWAEGQALSLDETIAEALTVASAVTTPPVEPPGTSAPRHPDGLTAREVDVLRLIAAGKSTREIADTLVISEGTVEHHITNLYGKIGARGRADATAYAFRHNLA